MDKVQIYKIYINEVEVILKATALLTIDDATTPKSLVIHYTGNKKHLLDYINLLEKSFKSRKLIIHYSDFEKLKTDFKLYFSQISAGGGLVRNEFGEYLFIFRRGSWDLPKGKIEAKETKREAALREISEETGVKNMTIIEKIMVTRHTYRNNVGRRIIKKSHWYLVETKKQPLKPQKEEDIDKAVWMTIQDFLSKKRSVYPNILEVIKSQVELDSDSKVQIKVSSK